MSNLILISSTKTFITLFPVLFLHKWWQSCAVQCSALSRKAAASSTHARHWGEGVDVIQELVVVVILGVFSSSLVTWSSAVSSSRGALKLLLPQTQGSALTDGTKKPNWPLVFNEPGCRWWLWKKNNGKKKSLIRSYQVISQWSNTNANYCYWWQVELLKHNAAFRLKKNPHTIFTKNKLFNTQQGASQIAWQCTY